MTEYSYNNNKKYASSVKIAVLFYGQYRTGDVLLPRFKEMIDLVKDRANVDVFVALKSGNSYLNNKIYRDDPATDDRQIDSEIDETVIKNIKTYLNPVTISIMDGGKDIAKLVEGGRAAVGRILTGLINAILLKQLHERDEGITYDVVIPIRFDIVVKHLNLFNCIFNWYNNVTNGEYQSIFKSYNPAHFFVPVGSTEPYAMHHSTMCMPIANDIIFWGSGMAFDLLAAHALHYIAYEKSETYADPNQVGKLSMHEVITRAARKCNISMSGELPHASKRSVDIKDQTLFVPNRFIAVDSTRDIDTDNIEFISATILRETSTLTLDPLDDESFDIWYEELLKYG